MKQGWITTLPAIADYMNICEDTLIRWMKTYEMPIVKIGHTYCAVTSQLDEWFKYCAKNKKTLKYPPKSPYRPP